MDIKQNKDWKIKILLSLTVLIMSYFTYFRGYENPPALFWDENYHISSSEKYLEGVMFMEPHPPLGKLLIAFGEYIFHPNDHVDKSGFVKTDYIKNGDFPKGYSFRGVRFFSSFFGMLGAVVFFFILWEISKNYVVSFLFSSLYLFENALILQSRAAMLEGSQIFFLLLAVWYFLHLMNKEKIKFFQYLILGILIGFAVAIKLNAAILVILFLFLFYSKEKNSLSKAILFLKDFIAKGVVFSVGILVIFFGFYYIHFSMGQRIVDGNDYEISENYKKIIRTRETSDVSNFFVMFIDSLHYTSNYENGVPEYDVCKEGENGSLPLTWPFGNKSINYRWEKDGNSVSYLYLQGNPFVWVSGLVGIILNLALVLSKFVFKTPIKDKRLFSFIVVFSILYVCYMIVMFNTTRVMYLYHYFIPLLFSLFLFFIIFNYIYKEKVEKSSTTFYLLVSLYVAVVFVGYCFFSPLTYYFSLTTSEFHLRQWFDFWHLQPVK